MIKIKRTFMRNDSQPVVGVVNQPGKSGKHEVSIAEMSKIILQGMRKTIQPAHGF